MPLGSTISIQEKNGKVKTIFCQHDGDLIRRILVKHYSNESLVRKLIELGDVHFLDNFVETTCAYVRDMDESHSQRVFRIYPNLQEMLSKERQIYNHVFVVRHGEWKQV